MEAKTLIAPEIPAKLCGKTFGLSGLATVQEELRRKPAPNRAELARRVCARLDWHNAKGHPQLMSARVGLLRLHRAGHIRLPPPTKTNGNGRRTPDVQDAGTPGLPVVAPARALSPLSIRNRSRTNPPLAGMERVDPTPPLPRLRSDPRSTGPLFRSVRGWSGFGVD